MPLGSLPPSERLPRIEQLMSDRRKFDVSAEAFLIRVVKTTAEPTTMFSASAIEGSRPQYHIDYSIASKSAPASVSAGGHHTERQHCLRVYSHRTNGPCIGGLDRRQATCDRVRGNSGICRHNISSRRGHYTISPPGRRTRRLRIRPRQCARPDRQRAKIICQLVNDQAKIWGGGVARASAKKYPAAQQDFSQWIGKYQGVNASATFFLLPLAATSRSRA